MEFAQYFLDIGLDVRAYLVQNVRHRPLQHDKKALRSVYLLACLCMAQQQIAGMACSLLGCTVRQLTHDRAFTYRSDQMLSHKSFDAHQQHQLVDRLHSAKCSSKVQALPESKVQHALVDKHHSILNTTLRQTAGTGCWVRFLSVWLLNKPSVKRAMP